jgi:hypothetical protein
VASKSFTQKLISQHSFVDRDMFMRYFGGGISHTATTIQSARKDIAMEVDEDAKIMNSNNEVMGTEAQVLEFVGHHSLEELQQMASAMAEGVMTGDWKNVERTLDSDDDRHDSDDEDMDDDMSTDNNDDDLGPEDGEDEGYVETGYGEL